ncbi:signal peptidase II [Microbacterium sp.]|uniref:signal peptidase II n=1 Tax=Microbacterium sp. TaxID=51671 RepID=UPI0025E2D4B5|nr:signal peptidase II [Microbacterium sp.]MBT9605030.1 signal peptidase II [Microbacterium sp.]
MTAERTRPFAVACIVAAAAVLIDQLSKALALSTLSDRKRIPLIGDAFGLQLAFNPGAVLGMGSGATWILTVIGVAAVAGLFVMAARARTIGWATGVGLVLGGAVGNLIDRFMSPPGFAIGHVTDFLAYGRLFIGNLADVFLAAGAIALAVMLMLRQRSSNADRTQLAPSPKSDVFPESER